MEKRSIRIGNKNILVTIILAGEAEAARQRIQQAISASVYEMRKKRIKARLTARTILIN